jgi:hypothetical protein
MCNPCCYFSLHLDFKLNFFNLTSFEILEKCYFSKNMPVHLGNIGFSIPQNYPRFRSHCLKFQPLHTPLLPIYLFLQGRGKRLFASEQQVLRALPQADEVSWKAVQSLEVGGPA